MTVNNNPFYTAKCWTGTFFLFFFFFFTFYFQNCTSYIYIIVFFHWQSLYNIKYLAVYFFTSICIHAYITYRGYMRIVFICIKHSITHTWAHARAHTHTPTHAHIHTDSHTHAHTYKNMQEFLFCTFCILTFNSVNIYKRRQYIICLMSLTKKKTRKKLFSCFHILIHIHVKQ